MKDAQTDRARSLKRILQDESSFLHNQEIPLAYTVSLLRAEAKPGTSFRLEAPDFPDHVCFLHHKDLGRHHSIRILGDSYELFAKDKIEYPGQVVALIAAPDKKQLDAWLQRVRIVYGAREKRDQGEAYTLDERQILSGNPELAFASAPHIVSNQFHFNNETARSYEPKGAFASWENDGLIVRSATVWPQLVRKAVSEATGLAQKYIEVISEPSARNPERNLLDATLLACYASMAALTTVKPVQLFLSGLEDLRFGSQGFTSSISLTSAHLEDGRMIALKAEIEHDVGRQAIASQDILQYSILGLCSSYRIPAFDTTVKLGRSDTAPRYSAPFFGFAVSCQAMEMHVEEICIRLGLDPIQWRIDHFALKGDSVPWGTISDATGSATQCLTHVTRFSDFSRKHGAFAHQHERQLLRFSSDPQMRAQTSVTTSFVRGDAAVRGIGVASSFQPHGFLSNNELATRPKIKLELGQDGSLKFYAPVHPSRSGVCEAWEEAAREILGIDPALISYAPFSSEHVEDCGPACASRVAALTSPLVLQALKSLAVKRSRGKGPWEVKAAFQNTKRANWSETEFSGQPWLGRTWVSAVVEAELDPQSLSAKATRVWMSVGGASLINPEKAQAVLRQSVKEVLEVYEDDSWGGRKIETRKQAGHSLELPQISIEFVAGDEQGAARLAKPMGIGDLAHLVIPAAFMNAVCQCAGSFPSRIPARPSQILDILAGLNPKSEESDGILEEIER